MLDLKMELEQIGKMYEASPRINSFRALVGGGTGTGKTFSLRTARQPILIHSFDPDGQVSIRDFIQKGGIYVDNRYEQDDIKDPKTWLNWEKEYFRLKTAGVFNQLGTFALDSATTWSATAMNLVLKKAGRPGGTPQQNDYLPAMVMVENAIKDMTSLPCDIILLAHEDPDKDEATGRMFIHPLFIGKLKLRVPLLFSEVYFAQAKETSKGTEYSFLTQATGMYKARTRLGANGRFEQYEKPDFMYLRGKAGLSTNHLNYEGIAAEV